MSGTLVELLPKVLRAHPRDSVVTGLLTDGMEYVFELDGWMRRIPADRNTSPVFGGESIPSEAALYRRLGLVGTTGWDWLALQTIFGIGDFDAAKIGENGHGDGHDQATLNEVIEAARRAGWVWVRYSKGGRGFHIIAPCQPLPAVTGEQHTHNINAILDRLCKDADFDFRKYLCSNQVGYFWAPGDLPENAFKVIVEPTQAPPEITVPEFHPQPASEPDAVFTAEHHKDIDVMQAAGFIAAIDGPRLLAHVKGFEALVKATRPGCDYSSTSPGRHPSNGNCWAYPREDGGWSLTRFNKTPEGEALCWHANNKGFASATIPARPDDEMVTMTTWGLPDVATETVEKPAAAQPAEPAVKSAEQPAAQPAKKDSRLQISLLTCQTLDSTEYEEEYLIEGTLVKGQPGIVGGPKKTLKTSLLVDMLISLATGTAFLGRLAVTRECKAVLLSGESGLATLRRTAQRVCKSRDLSLPSIKNLWLSDFLPWFGDKKHLDGVERLIEETGCEVLAIDPTYLCMSGVDAGNIFSQGDKLRGISQICRDRGVCLILAHHLRKQGKVKNASDYEPRELDDLSWSGFAEFCRQWILIGRREMYTPGTGLHKLWLSIGGSAGHSMLWAADIDEGIVDNRPTSWNVSLASPSEARAEKKASTIRDRLLATAKNFPAGETKQVIIDTSKLRRDHATLCVFDYLVNDELLVPVEIKKAGRTYEGFRLAEVSA